MWYREKDVDISFAQDAIDEYKVWCKQIVFLVLIFTRNFCPGNLHAEIFCIHHFFCRHVRLQLLYRGKWWIYSVRKEKVCYLVLLQFFWAFVSVEKLDNYDMEYVWYYNLKC